VRIIGPTVIHSRDVLAALRADGWVEVAQKGSHIHLKHSVKAGRVTVPHPNRDLPIGTLKSIERQARIKLR
jgi:predicted RNA binding protein YcfA (HicA-like mRNA interferase family)